MKFDNYKPIRCPALSPVKSKKTWTNLGFLLSQSKVS
jgi:hypothetical protein